jgi:hypothetical protein
MAAGWGKYRRERRAQPAPDEPPDDKPERLALEVAPDELEGVAVVVAELVLRSREWMHRRVDVLSFADESTYLREVTLDVTVPTGDPFPAVERALNDDQLVPLPIALMRKTKLNLFSLTTGSGREVSPLTRRARGEVARQALSLTARGILRKEAPEPIADDLAVIAKGSAAEARTCLARFTGAAEKAARIAANEAEEAAEGTREKDRSPTEVLTDDEPARADLMSNPQFASLVDAFAKNFLLIVELPRDAGRCRLTFSHEERLSRPAPRSRLGRLLWGAVRAPFAVARGFGWIPRRLPLPAPAATSAASFHLEAMAPDALHLGHPRLFWREDESEEVMVCDDDEGSFTRVHLYAHEIPDRVSVWGRVELWPRPSLVLRGAVLASLFVAVVLGAGALVVHDRALEIEGAGPAILLIVPSLVSLYLTRPTEAAVPASTAFRLRVVGTAPALFAFIGAAFLVVRGADESAATPLAVLAGVSFVVSLLLMIGWRRSRWRFAPFAGEK